MGYILFLSSYEDQKAFIDWCYNKRWDVFLDFAVSIGILAVILRTIVLQFDFHAF